MELILSVWVPPSVRQAAIRGYARDREQEGGDCRQMQSDEPKAATLWDRICHARLSLGAHRERARFAQRHENAGPPTGYAMMTRKMRLASGVPGRPLAIGGVR